MMPLNYAILKHFVKVDEACADDVINALKGEYGNFKALKKSAVTEALMTGKANGLLVESRFELLDNGELVVYYKVDDYGRETINGYIPD